MFMSYKSLLESLATTIKEDDISVRRYNLSDMISESYKTLYDCPDGSKLQKLAEAHLEDVRNSPTEIDRLSVQLCKLKEAISRVNSGSLRESSITTEKKPIRSRSRRDFSERCTEDEITETRACPECEEDPCVCESMNEDEDPDLTDEELEELTKHLETIRKERKNPTPKKDVEEGCSPKTPMKEESTSPRRGIRCSTHRMKEAEDPEVTQWDGTINGETPRFAVINADGTYAGKFCISDEEARELCYASGVPGRHVFELTPVKGYRESKKVTESYKGLESFAKNSSSKAFFKTFKKMHESLKEGKALTRQESMNLYKAANSAMTQLSVELEHNPEFLETFKECTSLLSTDVAKLLESMKNGKAPSKNTMKSLAKFSEALLNESLSLEDAVEDSHHHFMYDVGRVPYVDDILIDITNNYDEYEDAEATPESGRKFYDQIKSILMDKGLEIKESKKVEESANGSVEDYLSKMKSAKDKSAVEKIVRAAKGNPNADKAYKKWKSLNEVEDEEDIDIEDPSDTGEDDFVGDDEGEVQSEEADNFDQEYADARVEMHKDLVNKYGDGEDPAVQEKIAQDAAEVTSLPGITDEQIAEVSGDSEDESPAEEEGEESEDDISDDELAELKKHLKEMRESKRLGEALITDFLPEDKLRSEFSKHGMEILSFEQGNLVKVKTKYGTKITCKIVKSDDGEFEVFNPDYKREFIIKE